MHTENEFAMSYNSIAVFILRKSHCMKKGYISRRD